MNKARFFSRSQMTLAVLALEAILVIALISIGGYLLFHQRQQRIVEHAIQETKSHIQQLNERLGNYFRGFGKDIGLIGRLMRESRPADFLPPTDLVRALLLSRREYISLSYLDIQAKRNHLFHRQGNRVQLEQDKIDEELASRITVLQPGGLNIAFGGMRSKESGVPWPKFPFFELILPLKRQDAQDAVVLILRISGNGLIDILKYMTREQTARFMLVEENGRSLAIHNAKPLATQEAEPSAASLFPQRYPKLWASYRNSPVEEPIPVGRSGDMTGIFRRLDPVAYLSLLIEGEGESALFGRVLGDHEPWTLVGLIGKDMMDPRLAPVKRAYGIFLALIFALLFFFYLFRFRWHIVRERGRRNLELAYHNLERLVEQRAKALSDSNRQLALQNEDLRRLHQQSEEQKSFLQEVIDSLTHPFFVVEPENRAILLQNRAAREKLSVVGLKGEDAFLRLQNLCAELGRDCPISRVMRTGQATSVEYTRSAQGGHAESLEIIVYPVGSMDSTHKMVIVYMVDITEKHRLQEQFFQSQKMEAVGQLAGGIAHDFNNLLSVMIGYSEQLVEELNQDERYAKRLRDIHQAAQKAGNLTQKLLLFSRKHPHKPRLIDINIVIEDMLDLLRPIIGVSLGLMFKKETRLFPVMIDRSQFEQVIMNLLVNARDAMPQGGEVEIKTHNVVFKKEFCRHQMRVQAGPHVILSIEDKGIGMDASTMDRIFDPFFTTKNEQEGTGLGLSTVYGIVKQHGGFVLVSSQLGKGTKFRIFLPARREGGEADAQQQDDRQIPGGNELVLLVDDDRSVREMVSMALIKKGYRVMSTGDGQDALRLLRDHLDKISLVLSDVIMPRMSGVELASQISQMKPQLPVLLMSGFMTDELQEVRTRQEEWPLIQKPFSFADLFREMRFHLDRKAGPPNQSM